MKLQKGSWVINAEEYEGPKGLNVAGGEGYLRALGSLGPVRVGLAWSCETTPEIAACCRSAYQCLASDQLLDQLLTRF